MTRPDIDPTDDNGTDMARRPRPVTDETRQDVKRLHAAGLGRNEIARELRISGSSVTGICQKMDPPLSFDRAESALATRARTIDMAETRSRISKMLLVRAEQQLEAMDAPYLLGSFGGKDNIWNETLLDTPPIEVQRNQMTIAAIAVQRHADLVKIDSGRDVEASESVLEMLARGLDAASNALRVGKANDPTIPGTDPELNPQGVDEGTD